MSNEIKTRPLTPTEQQYTYAQSMQLEGQTGTIGHLRGDFATTGYGFYTTWFDTRPQWKSDEFKADLDTVINALREDKGLLHNRYDMSAFARHFPESAIKGNYCTEYGFRVDTEKHAFLLRCNCSFFLSDIYPFLTFENCMQLFFGIYCNTYSFDIFYDFDAVFPQKVSPTKNIPD